MNAHCAPIGILAGGGAYPALLAERILNEGHRVPVAAIKGHFSAKLPAGCGPRTEFPLGAFGNVARFFLAQGAAQIIFAGNVARHRLGHSLRPDRHALRLLPKALLAGDDSLLRRVADTFMHLGLQVISPRPYLGDLLAPRGLLAGPDIDQQTREDIELARSAAKKLGAADQGQAAIAFCGRVVSLEDRRGTNALIARAPGPGAVLAKVLKPGQDARFDLPTIGPTTALIAGKLRFKALAVEADGVVLLEKNRLLQLCAKRHISLIGV